MNYSVNLQPSTCIHCNGKVIHISNDAIYGKQYGSGYCYVCTKCHAHVGTHKNRPLQALGILATDEMRDLRKKCHDLFDKTWFVAEQRKQRYAELADKLGLSVEVCHFAYFSMELLEKAYKILLESESCNDA